MDAAFVAHTCNDVILPVHSVGLGAAEFRSSFRSQSMETVFLLSKASSPTSSLWIAFKNVNLSSISSLIELGIAIGSKNDRILDAAASMNIVEWLEITCLGFVDIDYTKIPNFRFDSNSVISQRQTAKSLYNEIIHHQILVEWAEEPPDRTCFIDLSASEFLPSWKITLSFQSHLSIFYMFYEVTRGPFGVDDSVQAARPIVIFRGFLVYSFIWSVPEASVTTELGTMFLENGGYAVWELLVWVQRWFSGVIDKTLYPALPLHYLKSAIRIRKFLATFKQHIVLVRSADDANVFLANDFQNPLQRTLFSLELPRALSHNPSPLCEFPTTHDPQKGELDESSNSFKQNGRRQHQNLAQDISIQV